VKAELKPESVVSVDPEIMSGTPCFRGTRVPVKTLFEYLAAGDPLDEFFEDFPSVTRPQVQAVLAEAGDAVLERHGATAA
jgi:uncharacterized protein (DUF433 family)